MAISVICPACGNRYELEQQFAGEDVECECGQRFRVSSPAPNTGWQSLTTEFDESAETLLVVCPNCAAEYDLEPDDVGAEVDCECGCTFTVPESSGSAATEPAPVVDSTDNDSVIDESSANSPVEDKLHEPKRASVSLLESWKSRRLWISATIAIGLIVVTSLVVVVFFRNDDLPAPRETESADQADHQEYVQKLALAGGTLLIAHQLANDRTDPALVEQVRFLLADSYLLAHSPSEAAILGEAVARWADPQTDIAPQAAFVALSAFLDACETESDDKNLAEMEQLFRIARLIETRWPQHSRVDEVRLQIGRMSSLRGDAARAALWFHKVSRSSKQYAEAQMLAGQAYWTVYLEQSGVPSNLTYVSFTASERRTRK